MNVSKEFFFVCAFLFLGDADKPSGFEKCQLCCAMLLQPHVVSCSVCKAVDSTHFVRDVVRGAQAHQDHNLIGLVCSWNSETREAADPSPMDDKATYLNYHIQKNLLDSIGTAFDPEIAAQTGGARELKRKKDITEYRTIVRSLLLCDLSSSPKSKQESLKLGHWMTEVQPLISNDYPHGMQ